MRLMAGLAARGVLMVGCASFLGSASWGASPGPSPAAPAPPIIVPQDRPYPGLLSVSVDATDLERRIVHVHETLSGIDGNTVLLYPKWLPGTHAPEGPIDRFAGLKITSQGGTVTWTRDPVDVYAFHLHAGAATRSVDIDFEYLSPTSADVGSAEISRDILILEWNAVVLYPAGYFVRDIPAQATLKLPAGWTPGSALEPQSVDGATTRFKPVSLETLVDSPVYAGKFSARLDLDPGGPAPVHMDLFADRAESLVVKPEELEAYRNLVKQAYSLFGSHHYAHYDFLYSLSDEVEHNGLEHHQSSEDGSEDNAFTEWDKSAAERDLLSHEFTHSWNGKFRRPADLWTPNYDVPMRDSLLWVYEGQTQYWGEVLTARAGLWTLQQALDQLAFTAASYEHQSGRQWRSLEDTTNDEIIDPRRPLSWRSWQRFEDYYSEGALIWLEVDTLIREQSNGRKSLDDFARTFFGIDNGSVTTVTYTFDYLVKALNAVWPHDWSGFLRQRLDGVSLPVPLEGITRGGYALTYSDVPNELLKMRDSQRKRVSLQFSIGVEMDEKNANVVAVLWDSPAFKAGLTEGTQILAVNGVSYSGEVLMDAIREAKDGGAPIELITKNAERFRVVTIDYHGGLRYPHLERDPSRPARLEDILAARP
jgi:predicted metalloprotease with PDZ domain